MVKSFTVISAVFQYFYASIHSIDGTRVVVCPSVCAYICMCVPGQRHYVTGLPSTSGNVISFIVGVSDSYDLNLC